MGENSRLELFSSPIESSLEELGPSPLQVFFALGIVNPMGPTLTTVAAVGEWQPGDSLPVVEIVLNPFSQTVSQLGRFHVGETWRPISDLAPLFSIPLGSCPTLVLTSRLLEGPTRASLVQTLLSHFDDVAETCAGVLKYPNDPATRVSHEMRGRRPDPGGLSADEAAEELAAIVLKPEHFKAELGAFFYAWQGSIEQTGLPPEQQRLAFGIDAFQSFFVEHVSGSVSFPESDEPEEPPEVRPPTRLKVESIEQVEDILARREWLTFEEDRLVDLLRWLFFAYGHAADTSWIPKLSEVYRHALQSGMEVDTRLMLQDEMERLVLEQRTMLVVHLPFLVLDSDLRVTSKSAIDFVSASDYRDGELYALTELRQLFLQDSLADRAMVFGALVAMGDPEVMEFVTELRPLLTDDEVRRAAQVHTMFPQHLAIQFWLGWAEELVRLRTDEAEGMLGSCASALVLVLRHDRVGVVAEGKRNFPCQLNNPAISKLQQWTIEEYGDMIAPRLYALEAAEAPPRVFSEVLRPWGLEPGAALAEQFISDARPGASDRGRLRQARGANEGDEPSAARRFLRRLFGGR